LIACKFITTQTNNERKFIDGSYRLMYSLPIASFLEAMSFFLWKRGLKLETWIETIGG